MIQKKIFRISMLALCLPVLCVVLLLAGCGKDKEPVDNSVAMSIEDCAAYFAQASSADFLNGVSLTGTISQDGAIMNIDMHYTTSKIFYRMYASSGFQNFEMIFYYDGSQTHLLMLEKNSATFFTSTPGNHVEMGDLIDSLEEVGNISSYDFDDPDFLHMLDSIRTEDVGGYKEIRIKQSGEEDGTRINATSTYVFDSNKKLVKTTAVISTSNHSSTMRLALVPLAGTVDDKVTAPMLNYLTPSL